MLTQRASIFFITHIIYNKRKPHHRDEAFSVSKTRKRNLIKPYWADKDNNTNETHKKQEYHYCIVMPIQVTNNNKLLYKGRHRHVAIVAV